MSSEAIQVLQALAEKGVRVTELATDSRRVRAGDLFLAYPGARQDGRACIAEAIAAGAQAVLWERTGFAWEQTWQVPNIAVQNLRALAGHLAHEVYRRPSERMAVVGVTGTNGKTSCTQWIAQAQSRCGKKTGVIGTLGAGFPAAPDEGAAGLAQPSPNTTPDPVLLHRTLASMLAQGAQAVALEATSIGLDQGRINGVVLATAVFTNLSRDHLDYHRDMEHYARAKRRLFEIPSLKHAVLNLDDVQGVAIAQSASGTGLARVGYSIFADGASRSGMELFLEAQDLRMSPWGTAFRLKSSWGEALVETPVIGRYNASNLLAVLGALLAAGMSLDDAVREARRLAPVPGRLQRLGGGARPLVVVDYAHTPEALEKVAQTLKEVVLAGNGRLIVVFGCGGERDRGKRPLMGAIAARHADLIIVTSDNPRNEKPGEIIAEIRAGIASEHEEIVDRREAIARAVSLARTADVVLIAGKGHEPYQDIAGRKVPFSDLGEAQAALSGWVQ